MSLEEQLRGRFAALHRARKPDELLRAYRWILATLDYYCQAQVLPFDQAALDQFNALRKQGVRIGTLDLRIAAIALARGATLLSRNLRDFRQVPGLVAEDWTR